METYKLKIYKIEELLNWRINTQLLKANLPDLLNEIKRENIELNLHEFRNKFTNESMAFSYIVPEARIIISKEGDTILKITNIELLKIFDRDYVENVLIKIEKNFLIIILQYTTHQSGGIAILNLINQKLITVHNDEFGPEQLFFLPSRNIFVGYSVNHYYSSNFENFFIIDSIGQLRFVDFQKTKRDKFEVLIEEPLLNMPDTLFGVSFDEDRVRIRNSKSELYYSILKH
jgi:hypothetical protein